MLSGNATVLVGWRALAARAEAIEALHRATGAAIDARLPWLEVWARFHTERSITALATYDRDGALEGFAPLAFRSIGPFRSVVAIGQGFSDHSSVIWRDPDAARRLGGAVHELLADLHRPWQLWFQRLTPGPGLDAFADALGSVREIGPGPESPEVVFGADRDPRRYESANARKSLARMYNRLRRDGRELTVDVVTDTATILGALPAVLRAHRERDLQLRGWSVLDEDVARGHYVGVVERLAGLGAIRLLLVRIDGELAAYVVAIVDGRTLRIYDNRVVPGFLEYSAGAIANSAVLHLAARDPELSVLDWGIGAARYKHSSATRSVPSSNLAAWSTGPIRSAWRAGLEVSRRTRRLRDRRPARRGVGRGVPG